MKKNLSLVLLFSLCYQLKSQNNIIPNGNFEFSSPPVCVSSIISFNTNVSNWKVAEHSNGEGVGTPEWLNFLTCSYNAYCDGIGVFVNSNRFIAIKADIRKCKKIGSGFNIKRFHEAVVVGLDGGASFTQYAYYTIRYKIIPIRASLIEGDEFESTCVSLQTDCHLRVFLSKKGTKHWNDVGGNAQQEVVNANTTIPEIRLEGKWLDTLGFKQGQKVKIQQEKCRLVITIDNSNDT